MNVDNLPASVGSANWEIPDPGDNGTIPGYKTGYVEIVTAGAENRTIAAPAKPGLKLLIYGKTLVGACTIAVTNYIGTDDSLVLSTAGVPRVLESVREGSTLTWKQTAGASWESLATSAISASSAVITSATIGGLIAAGTTGIVITDDTGGVGPAGYGSVGAAGSAVAQASSITTAVQIDSRAGAITTVSSTLAAAARAEFTLTNSTIANGDIVLCTADTAGTGTPVAYASNTATGSCTIVLENKHASAALNNTVTIGFIVHKLTANA